MRTDGFGEDPLGATIMDYSILIKAFIHKYRVYDYGVDPDDLLQEVRIRLWKILKNESNINKPTSYIKKIVSTVVIDYIRKYKREENIIFSEKSKCLYEHSATNSYSAQENNRGTNLLLETSLNKLIPSRRAVVKLYLLNMSIQEISSIFAWSSNKTRNLLYRGLSDLKRYLKQVK